MTVIARCRELRAAIEAFGEARKAEAEAQALAQLSTSVATECDLLRDSVEKTRVLQEEGLPRPDPVNTQNLRKLFGEIRSSVTTTKKRPPQAAQFLRALKKVAEDAKSGVKNRITLSLKETRNSDSTALRQYEQVAGFTEEAQLLRALLQTPLEHVLSMPANELRNYLHRYTAVRAKLPTEEWPAEVQTFLREANRGGAQLKLFTEGVREWLARKKLLESVRVIIATGRKE